MCAIRGMTYLDSQDDSDRRAENPSAYLGIDIFDIFNALDKALVERASPHGITNSEYALLWHCLDGERTATQLAQVLPMDGSRISRVVTDLVDKGLLSRRRLAEDRRIVMLSLTSEGMELTSRIFQKMQDYYAEITEGISEEEMQAFSSVRARILANHASMQSQPQ